MLAERAGVLCGVTATAVRTVGQGVQVETSSGALQARALVGADGLRSRVSGWMGWRRPARSSRSSRRHALVGHWEAPGHALDEIVVTLLGDVEVYVSPSGPTELLAANWPDPNTWEATVAETPAMGHFEGHYLLFYSGNIWHSTAYGR